MAATRDVDIVLSGRDKLTAVFEDAEKTVQSFSKQVERANARMRQSMQRGSGNMRTFGAQGQAAFGRVSSGATAATGAMAGATLGMGKLMAAAAAFIGFRVVSNTLRQAVTEANSLETGLARVATMLESDVPETMNKFGPAIQQAQKDFGQSVGAMTGAVFDLISSGQSADDATELMRIGAMSAAAGFTDAATAVDAMTTIMNAYGAGAEDAQLINDLLFSTMKEGKVTYEELARNVSTIVPTANAAGVSLQELSAAMATALQIEKPERAMTKLRAVMNAAAKDGKGFMEFLGEFEGMSLEDILGAGVSEEAAGGIALLAGQWDELQEQIGKAGNVAGTTQEAFEKVATTTDFKIAQMRESWNVMVGEIGSAIKESEAFEAAIDGLTFVFDNLFELLELGWTSVQVKGLEAALTVVSGWEDFVHFIKQIPSFFALTWELVSQSAGILFDGIRENLQKIWEGAKKLDFNVELEPVFDVSKFDTEKIKKAADKFDAERPVSVMEAAIAAELNDLEMRQRDLIAQIAENERSRSANLQDTTDRIIGGQAEGRASSSAPQPVEIVRDMTLQGKEERFVGLDAAGEAALYSAPAEALLRASDEIARRIAAGFTASGAIEARADLSPGALDGFTAMNTEFVAEQRRSTAEQRRHGKSLIAITEASSATAEGIKTIARTLSAPEGQITVYGGLI